MLKLLRELPPNAKRKLSATVAGVITLFVGAVWFLHTSDFLGKVYQSTAEQGVALFSIFDQNVEIAYVAFNDQFSYLFPASTTDMMIGTTTATSTDQMINTAATSTASSTIEQ